jgi:hypothetical protein
MVVTAELSDDAVLGRGLPPRVESLIREAGLLYDEPLQAQQRLEQACSLAPGHPATLIALYRFHFYGNRLAAARDVAVAAMICAARKLGLPEDWRRVAPNHELFGGMAALPRFYLFALKGYAYLSLRLGAEHEGATALAVLRRLDPLERIGGRVLETVLARRGLDDYADVEGEPL